MRLCSHTGVHCSYIFNHSVHIHPVFNSNNALKVLPIKGCRWRGNPRASEFGTVRQTQRYLYRPPTSHRYSYQSFILLRCWLPENLPTTLSLRHPRPPIAHLRGHFKRLNRFIHSEPAKRSCRLSRRLNCLFPVRRSSCASTTAKRLTTHQFYPQE